MGRGPQGHFWALVRFPSGYWFPGWVSTVKLSEGTQPTLLDVSLSAHLRAASCIRRTVIAAQRVRLALLGSRQVLIGIYNENHIIIWFSYYHVDI